MRAVAITGPGRASVVTQTEPVAKDDVVKVELRVVPMCTEFRDYAAGRPAVRLGHEAAGVVVDPGGSHRVSKGDRVVVMPQYGCGKCANCTSGEHIYCRDQRDVLAETGSVSGTATFAEYMLKPDWLLLPVPADVSLRHAAMACCALGPSFNAAKAMKISVADTLLVVGCGPVGLGAVINGVARGARVVAWEINPYRAQLAQRLGAHAVLDPTDPYTTDNLRDFTDGRGVDAAFDSTGVLSALSLLEEVLAPRARLSFVVLHQRVELHSLVERGLEVRGCWHWNHQRDGLEMLEVIRGSRAALDTLVTHSFLMDDVEDAFRAQLSGDCGKVLLFPSKEAMSSD